MCLEIETEDDLRNGLFQRHSIMKMFFDCDIITCSIALFGMAFSAPDIER